MVREVLADYHARVAVTTPQRAMGAFSQMFAGLTHHVRPPQLRAIAARVPKVLIVTGDVDGDSESSSLLDNNLQAAIVDP